MAKKTLGRMNALTSSQFRTVPLTQVQFGVPRSLNHQFQEVVHAKWFEKWSA